MFEYERIIQKVNRSGMLRTEIDAIMKDSEDEKVLDLTHERWENHLKNDGVFQRHVNRIAPYNAPKKLLHVKVQYLTNSEDFMDVVVVSSCIFKESKKGISAETGESYNTKPYISVKYCPPLDVICKAYATTETGLALELSTCTKLYVKNCDGAKVCCFCRSYNEKNRIVSSDDKDQFLCVRRIKLFDGATVVNVGKNIARGMMSRGPFWAVLKLNVDSRQFHSSNYSIMKICGNVKEIILFTESAFDVDRLQNMKFYEESKETDAFNASSSPSVRKSRDREDRDDEKHLPSYDFSPMAIAASTSGAENFEMRQDEEKTLCVPKRMRDSFKGEGREGDYPEGDYDITHKKHMY